MSQCGLCVGPCECPRPTGCNLCAPICECGAEEAQACRTLQDREAPETLDGLLANFDNASPLRNPQRPAPADD